MSSENMDHEKMMAAQRDIMEQQSDLIAECHRMLASWPPKLSDDENAENAKRQQAYEARAERSVAAEERVAEALEKIAVIVNGRWP